MLLAEVDERLADLGIDESARRRDAQPSLQVGVVGAHEIGKVVDLLQDFRGGAVVGMAGFGQRELPGGAVEQQRAELVLEFAHIFRK
ncbi:hypothetical protein D9M70_529680 [compost metagenome]